MKIPVAVFAVALSALTAAALPEEDNYAYRNRLAELHPDRYDAEAAPCAKDEVEIGGGWFIVHDEKDPVISRAAKDLADYFLKSMHVKVALVPPPGICDGAAVELRLDGRLKPRQSKIEAVRSALSARVAITGATARDVMQGCYRLEDELSSRGRPCVKLGSRSYTRMFSPRYSHSAWEMEKFPDVYLDQMAHAGMDAILVFISDPPDLTHNGRCDLNAEADRCARHGIDVYAYTHFHEKSAKMHPLDPGAEEWYDEIYGSIPKKFPKIRGMIAVGESSAFPSRDPKASGFWWKLPPGENGDYKRLNGFTPSPDWADWLKLVTKVTRKYKPDLEWVFWTYNWFWTPEEERLALLRAIPTNVTVHVTFEMGDRPRSREGVSTQVDDYSITSDGPGTTFAGEAKVCAERGIPVSTMSNTGGRTWDYGVLPYEPVPGRWIRRFKAMRGAARDWGLRGTMDSHHFGFWPSFVGELAKCAFTVETTDADLDAKLAELAARDYGAANAETVLAAWRDLDESFDWHSARNFDQYGPLRVGPTYPLFFHDEKIPNAPRYEARVESFSQQDRGWKYVFPDYRLPPEDVDGWLRIGERELACIDRAVAKLDAVLPKTSAVRRAGAERFVGLVKFMRCCAQTLQHVRRFKKHSLVYRDRGADAGAKAAAKRELLAVIAAERKNVEAAIPLVKRDSSLGFEPSMGYVADAYCLEWKLRDLDRMAKRIEEDR